jgi:hypothetical protein
MSGGMLRDTRRLSCSDLVSGAAALALAFLISGCSGGTSLFGGGPTAASPPPPSAAPPPTSAAPSSPSLTGKIANFFSGSSARSPQQVAGAAADLDCPLIDIRQGASTLTIGPTGDETNNGAMSLKYQGTFVRAARECAVVNGQMVMKVGIQGRIIIGPAGGPGEVDVPLRIAVVQEAPGGSKLIVTKFIRLPVTVASNDDNPMFSHIEEGLSFPVPSAADIDQYTVYIGFDPIEAAAQDKAKEKPKPKPKLKPKPKPAAAPAANPG